MEVESLLKFGLYLAEKDIKVTLRNGYQIVKEFRKHLVMTTKEIEICGVVVSVQDWVKIKPSKWELVEGHIKEIDPLDRQILLYGDYLFDVDSADLIEHRKIQSFL